MDETTVGERLARIETKLDATLARDDDKERRIRALEQMAWKIVGASLCMAILVPLIMKLLGF